MIDPFNRFAKGLVVKTKTAEEVVEGIKYNWFYQFGAPQTGIWSDNGTEFANVKMQELCKVWKIRFAAGAPYSPWSNGLNERNHGSCDRVLEKILIEDPKIDLQKAVTMAQWHNTNMAKTGAIPLRVLTGGIPKFPLVEVEEGTESLSVEEQIDWVRKVQKMHLEAELERLIRNCVKNRVPSYKHEELKEGDKVLVQDLAGKEWEGLFKFINHQ